MGCRDGRRARPRARCGRLRALPRRWRRAEGAGRARRSRARASPSWSTRVALVDGGGTYRWHAGAPARRAVRARRRRARGAPRRAMCRAGRRAARARARRDRGAGRRLEGEPESGAGTRGGRDPTRSGGVRRRGVRRGAARARGRARRPGRARRRPGLGLPHACVRARRTRIASSSAGSPSRTWSPPLRHGAPRTAAGRQLLRVVPRLPRERADLQPGERGLEGGLRAPLRRAHPGGAGQVAPERARHLAARGAPERRDRPAGLVGRGTEAPSLGGRGRGRDRRAAARDRPLAAAASSFPREGPRSGGAACCATAATPC